MGKPAKELIRCPECGMEQSFEAWKSINATRDPDIKEKLVARALTAFKCRRCEHEAEVPYNILYHDPKKKFAIWLIHGDNPPTVIEKERAKWEKRVKNHTLRVVTTLDRLIEKIAVFDDGQNDKVIELMKMRVGAQDKKTLIQEFFYAGCQKILTSETVIKLVGMTENGQVRYTVPLEPENEGLLDVLNSMETGPGLNEEVWLLVDQEYALKAIAKASR